jgi:hypothetical protein
MRPRRQSSRSAPTQRRSVTAIGSPSPWRTSFCEPIGDHCHRLLRVTGCHKRLHGAYHWHLTGLPTVTGARATVDRSTGKGGIRDGDSGRDTPAGKVTGR